MGKIRVLHIITRLIVGGAQEMVLLAARGVDSHRFECHVVAGPETGPEGSMQDEFHAAGVRVTIEPDLCREMSPLRDWRATRALSRLIGDGGYSLVHTHTAKAGILGREAARRAGVPAVHHVHGWSFSGFRGWRRRVFAALERRAARSSAALAVVTDRDIRKGLDAGIGHIEQYRLIRAGVDLSRFPLAGPEERRAARARLGIAPDEFCVGYVGRLAPQKAPLDLVRAVAAARQHGQLRFLLVGDGPMRAETERALHAARLTDSTIQLGLRRDIEAVLPACDVFASASLWEGLPRALIEAMAVGVPVAATAVDGVAELIVNRETGLLVPPGDPEALGRAITELREDPGLRDMVVAGARVACEEYSAIEMVRRLEALYDDVVGGTG